MHTAEPGASYRSSSEHMGPDGDDGGYRCDDCDKTFASDALKRVGGRAALLACPFCGHGVRKAVQGRVVAPFGSVLTGAFAFPLKEPAALLALGLAVALVSYLPFGRLFGCSTAIGYCFAIVRKTYRGGDRAPEPADFASWVDLLSPIVRYAFVFFTAQVPGLIALVAGAPPAVVAALGVLGLAYVPAALIAASEVDGFLVNPFAALAIIKRVAGPYARLLACLAIVCVVGIAVAMLGQRMDDALTMIPVLPRIVATVLGLYAPFTAARMLGLLMREHAEEL